MSSRQYQREDKIQNILNAAVEAFAESGYHHCHVSKIAQRAGVADGTIYLYFKNKEEILIRLFHVRMGEFISNLKLNLKKCTNTYERLHYIVNNHFSYMENNRSMAFVTQFELRQSDPQIRESINGPLIEYFKVIEEVIQTGIDNGESPHIDVKVARQLIFGALDEATSDWVKSRTQRSLISEVHIMLDFFVGAFRLGHCHTDLEEK